MVYSTDFRWRTVVLLYVYGISLDAVALVFGVSRRTLVRWMQRFEKTVTITLGSLLQRASRWPAAVLEDVSDYTKQNPCFYFEELRIKIQSNFPDVKNLPDSTLCRALRFDSNLPRKKLTKRARESVPAERADYVARLTPFYFGPSQLGFVDETTKDGCSMLRTHAWSQLNEATEVTLPFSRGKGVSVLVATDTTGIFAWDHVGGGSQETSSTTYFAEKSCHI